MKRELKVYKVGFIVFPGVEELDFVGAWEVLGTLEHFSKEACFKNRTVGTIAGPIKCAHGLTILPDETLSNLSDYDVIVVPGGPGVTQAMKNEQLLSEIRKVYEDGKLVCSVCTGSFILAEAGILEGKKATTYHTYVEKLSEYGAIPVKERVVVEGNVITGAGVSATIDVGLKIVEIVFGTNVVKKVAQWIEYNIEG